MSTFSKEQAEKLCREYSDFKIKEIKKIPVYDIKTILQEYSEGVFPDLLCIDAEGVDFDIIKSIDFDKQFPKVICVETLEYGRNLAEQKKDDELINYILNSGYYLYADTRINSIFVRKDWS